MTAGVLGRGWLFRTATIARVLPFTIFIVLMAIEPWLGRQLADVIDHRWLYGVRSLIVGGLLLLFWRQYVELKPVRFPEIRVVWLSAIIGLLVLVIWVTLDSGMFVVGHSGSGFEPKTDAGGMDWPLALMRLAGAALVVPLMEELFWRSFVMRWLEDMEFYCADPRCVTLSALALSSLAFGFEHSLWLAGILAGLAYGWLYIRSANLWAAILAHAITNAGLGIWVLATGAWHLW